MTEIEINQQLLFTTFADFKSYLVTDDIEYIMTHDDVSEALIYLNNQGVTRFTDELCVYYVTDNIFTQSGDNRNIYLIENLCMFTLQRLSIKFNQLSPSEAFQHTYVESTSRYKSAIKGNNIYKLTKIDENSRSNYIYSNGSKYTRFR